MNAIETLIDCLPDRDSRQALAQTCHLFHTACVQKVSFACLHVVISLRVYAKAFTKVAAQKI